VKEKQENKMKRVKAVLICLLFGASTFAQSRPLTVNNESPELVARGTKEFEALAVAIQAKTGHAVFHMLTHAGGDPTKPWVLTLYVVDGTKTTEWQESNYPRVLLGVHALQIAYIKYPNGYTGSYQGIGTEKPDYCTKGNNCA
jgi:hypothetical protein